MYMQIMYMVRCKMYPAHYMYMYYKLHLHHVQLHITCRHETKTTTYNTSDRNRKARHPHKNGKSGKALDEKADVGNARINIDIKH